MDLPLQLETDRLRLRLPRVEDADLVFARWTSDPEFTRHLSWRTHLEVASTRAWIEASRAAWASGTGHRPWLLELDGEEGPVGAIGVTLDGHRAQIGYGLARPWWGRGLMTEAASAVARTVAALDGVHRVWAFCDVDNVASARVLEKSGMIFEGTLRRWVVHPNVSELPRDVRAYALP